MVTHQPENYRCPFCEIIQAVRKDAALENSEVVYHNRQITAFLSLPRWPKNPLDVLVIPNEHFENIYELPSRYALPFHQASRALALALKAVYSCDGISTRQHNEPAGNQDVWHYHVHVTPRFTGDEFYTSKRLPFPESERLVEAGRIRDYMRLHQKELFEDQR